MPKTGKGARRGHRESVAARQRTVMSLRIAGLGYRRIAEQTGTSHVQAFRDCQAALAETLAERDRETNTFRRLELARLDSAQAHIWPKVQQGDCEAVRAVVRISERRAKLLGLDAAVAQRIDLASPQPFVVRHEPAVAQIPIAAILTRMRALATQLGEAPPIEVVEQPPSVPEESPAERYAAELEVRLGRPTNHHPPWPASSARLALKGG
jgi:hypothetical protein